MNFLSMLLGASLWILIDKLEFYFTEKFYAKRCGYDCQQCKAWSCRYKQCMYNKNKNEEIKK